MDGSNVTLDAGTRQEVCNGAKSPERYDRQPEHGADALALLDYLLSIPQTSPLHYWPTTAELQDMKIFGLRPVNRKLDLEKGKINGHHYDIEKISCGHGVIRWRLHWPNRPGYPKPKGQEVISWNDRERVATNHRGEVLPAFELAP
jgi:hypothetical protein